jgi:hypothetical protein
MPTEAVSMRATQKATEGSTKAAQAAAPNTSWKWTSKVISQRKGLIAMREQVEQHTVRLSSILSRKLLAGSQELQGRINHFALKS